MRHITPVKTMRNAFVRTTRNLFLGLLMMTLGLVSLSQLGFAADGAYTWSQLGGVDDGIEFTSLAISGDASRQIATSYGYDGAVYLSSDGGATWDEQLVLGGHDWAGTASSRDGAKLFALNRSCMQPLLVAQTEPIDQSASLYTSADGGATWTGSHSLGDVCGSSIASSADGTKLIVGTESGDVYLSNDSGATWTQHTVKQSDVRNVAISGNGMTLVTDTYVSSDGGTTWTDHSADTDGPWQSVAISDNGTHLVSFVAGNGKTYRSSDSGATWAIQPGAGQHSWSSIAMSPSGENLVGTTNSSDDYSTGGSVYTSTDGGETWTEQVGAGQRNWVLVAMSDDATKILTAADDGLYRSTTGGASVTKVSIYGSAIWRAIATSHNGQHVIAAANGLYTSDNGGATWDKRLDAADIPFGDEWSSVASSADGSHYVAASTCGSGGVDLLATKGSRSLSERLNSSIVTSSDGGATWVARPSLPVCNIVSVAVSNDGQKIIAATGTGSLYISTDQGATWTEQTSAGTRNWSSVTSSADGSHLAAAAYRNDAYTDSGGSIYTSVDGGATWTEQTSAGEQYWTSISSSTDGQKLFAATATSADKSSAGSVYASTDGGATWTEQTSAGHSYWTSISSSYDGSKLAAMGYDSEEDRGIVKTSTDGGRTWTTETKGILDYGSQAAISGDGSVIYTSPSPYGKGYLRRGVNPSLAPVLSLPLSTVNAPAGVLAPMKSATLSVRDGDTCANIDDESIALLPPTKIAVPKEVTIYGGLAFNLTCTTPGGSAETTLTLPGVPGTPSDLRVYKLHGTTVTEITKDVHITLTGGVATVTYTLVDGGPLDEDGAANGVITDPIFIGGPEVSGASDGGLANTGANLWLIGGIGTLLTVIGGIVILRQLPRTLRKN